MKKIFLLFGICTFCSASAQQKDVFDINKHLHGLMNKKNTPLSIINSSETIRFYVSGSAAIGNKLSPVLTDGNKVYRLPADNMPCVVADMKQFTTMPNISNPNEYFGSPLFKNNVPGTIPNAVKPYRLIASE